MATSTHRTSDKPSANEIYQLSDSSDSDVDSTAAPAARRHGRPTDSDDQDVIHLDTYDNDDEVDGSDEDESVSEAGELQSDASDSSAVMSFSSDDDLDSNVDGMNGSTTSELAATNGNAVSQRKRDASVLERIVGEGTVEPSPAKRRNTVRYFAPVDSSVKCWNCNETGHQSAQCPHVKQYKPCWICGLRGHAPSKCDQSLCFNCFCVGHQRHECPNARINTLYCHQCGSTTHTSQQCNLHHRDWKADLAQVRCYLCGQEGHICCATTPKATANATLFCANCATQGHSYLDCRQQRMETVIVCNNSGEPRTNANDDDSDSSSTSRRQSKRMDDRACFRCGQSGHIARDCPTSNTYTPDRYVRPQHRAQSESRYAANVRRFADNTNYRPHHQHQQRDYSHSYNSRPQHGGQQYRQGRSRERASDRNGHNGQPRGRYQSEPRYRR